MNRCVLVLLVAAFGLCGMAGAAAAEPTTVITSSGSYVVQPGSTTPAVVPPTAAPIQQSPTTVIVNQTPPPPPPKNDEDHHGWGEFNIAGGKAMFKGASGDFLDDSPAINVGFYGNMARFGQYGLNLGYVTGASLKGSLPGRLNPTINGVPATGAFTTDVKAHIVQVTPELRFGPLIRVGDFKIMPYLAGGGGFYWTRYNNDNLNFGAGSGTPASTNDYNGGWNAGGGVTVGLAPGVGIGADVRYHDIIYSNGPDTRYLLPEGKLVLFF